MMNAIQARADAIPEGKVPKMRSLIAKEIGNCYKVQPLGQPVKVKPPEPQLFGNFDTVA